MDKDTTIEELRKKIISFRDKRKWKKYHKPKDLAAAIAIESSELLELFLWRGEKEIKKMLKNKKDLLKIEHELADIINYCLVLSYTADIDLSESVKKKLDIMEEKYPRKIKYDKIEKYHKMKKRWKD